MLLEIERSDTEHQSPPALSGLLGEVEVKSKGKRHLGNGVKRHFLLPQMWAMMSVFVVCLLVSTSPRASTDQNLSTHLSQGTQTNTTTLWPSSREVCEFFPSAAQTWTPDGYIEVTGKKGKHHAYVESGNGHNVGFFNSNQLKLSSTETCKDENGFADCKANPNLTVANPFDTIKPNFQGGSSPNLGYYGSKYEIEPGQYGTVTIGMLADKTFVFKPGEYWIENLQIIGDGGVIDFSAVSPTVLNVKQLSESGATQFNHQGDPDNLVIRAFGKATGHITLAGHGDFKALVMSEYKIVLNGNTILRGAATADEIEVVSNSKILGLSDCILPSKEYSFSVEVKQDVGMMCGDNTPRFLLTTYENGVATPLGVSAFVSPSADDFTISVVGGIGSGSGNNFTSNSQGQLLLQVVPNAISAVDLSKEYQLTLSLTEQGSVPAQTVKYRFVPYELEAYNVKSNQSVSEVKVIAGRPQTVPVRMMACKTDLQPQVASNYHGAPRVSHAVQIPMGGLPGDLAFAPQLVNGIDKLAKLKLSESGQFNVALHERFSCDGYLGCPQGGSVEVNGRFTVKSRPWTLALCDDDDDTTPLLQSGNALGGEAFIAAGDMFNLKVKPIIWQPKGSPRDPVETSGYCGDHIPITQNFFHANAPQTTIELRGERHTPVAGTSTAVLESKNGLSKGHRDLQGSGADRHWLFSQLFWRDVGSMTVQASTLPRSYLGQNINLGYREIGRFYPKYFSVSDSYWDFWGADGQSLPYAYMEQPFDGVSFTVEARNAYGQPVANYSQFASDLQAQFNLHEFSGFHDRFKSPEFDPGQWRTSDGASVGTFSHQGFVECGDENTLCWQKGRGVAYRDGPFNKWDQPDVTQIGLLSKAVADPVLYQDPSDKLLQQPQIRFGRAVLHSVGGGQGATIALPLEIQYWQQGRFRTNIDDSRSRLDAQHFCYDVQWPEQNDTTTAVLENATQVVDGVSRGLEARQLSDNPIRESIRFSITLDQKEAALRCANASNNKAWFQYDWDGNNPDDALDEEDPNAVVTFGIYRGNDRVIFRGEGGILGQ